MTLSLQLPEKLNLKPTITVFGVGGGGGNAVANMIRSNLEGVKFVVANTDAQALQESPCAEQIQLGEAMTQGLGAGSYPEVGKASAEEAAEEVLDHLNGSNMVFITAGLGGGTGTGAAPVVARMAREQGILTVAVVTKPFHFEGSHRMRVAELGMQELAKYVDTLIVIPNQNLFRIADKNTTFLDAFKMADNVLYQGVRGITDLMIMPGMINLDFSDVRTVMSEMGKAMMGTGEGEGEKRAVEAAEAAIANPLLDNVSMKGAKGVLINITGGPDMTLYEVDEAANRIREEVDPDANIIFGSTFDQNLNGKVRVSVVSTGIDLISDSPSPTSGSESRGGSFKQGVYRQEPIKEAASVEAPKVAVASIAEQQSEPKEISVKVKPAAVRPQLSAPGKPVFEEPIAQSATLVFGNSAEKTEESFIAPEPVKPKTNSFASSNNGEGLFGAAPASARTTQEAPAAPKPSASSLFDQTAAGANAAKNQSSGFFGGFFGSKKEEGAHGGYSRPSEAVKSEVRERELVTTEDDLDVPAFLRRKPS